jgi:hypothetical protein
MNRIIRAVAVLFVSAMTLPLFAADGRNIVDEVIKMQRAGVAEENIMDFVHRSDGRFTVTADDVIALSDAKVSRTIIKAVLDEADVRNGVDNRRESDRETVVVSPRVVYPYYYDPFFYDPFWYGSRVSLGFRFGGYYGGHYGGGHSGHRGGGGRHGHR